MNLTALDACKMELKTILTAQNECITESGIVKNHCKYRYNILVQKAKEFQSAVHWLENRGQSEIRQRRHTEV